MTADGTWLHTLGDGMGLMRRVSIMLSSLAIAVGLTLVGGSPAFAAGTHAPNATAVDLTHARAAARPNVQHGRIAGVVPPRGRATPHATPGAACAEPACPLTYNGGPIQPSPRVYLLLWGPAWGTDTGQAATASYLENFYGGLGAQPQDAWSTINDQYTGSNGHPAFNGSVYAGAWQDTSTPTFGIDQNGLAAEADALANTLGITDLTNTQIVVATQSGTCPAGFYSPSCNPNGNYCAWHSYSNEPFINLPYVLDAGSACGENWVNGGSAGIRDGFSTVGGHEYAETLTDPYLNAWWDPNDSISGGENADKCAWTTPNGNLTLPTGTFAVQSIWSNKVNACAMSDPQGADTVTVTSPGNRQSVVGGKYSLTIPGSSSAGYALTWSATGLPSGLTISAATGVISGKFTTAAVYSSRVTAKDSAGASATAAFTWTVKADTGAAIKGYASMCLDAKGGWELVNNPVDLYTCNGTGAQRWAHVSGQLQAFGLCLGDTGGAGTSVYLTNCRGASYEVWSHPSNGEYVLKSNGLCLTDPGSSKVAGTVLQLAVCTATANQKWT